MTYISAELRREVIERARRCCEYCLLNQADNFLPFEIDHIIAEKHGGSSESDNLCLSCPSCNAYKGSDIGSIDWEVRQLTPLFNPRTQSWTDHFRLNGVIIELLTSVGRVTTYLLRLNHVERVAERTLLADNNRYPCQ